MLEHTDLDGATFLDIGSGSGLSSLAARRLGARVHSFDADVASVACTAELRRRYDPASENWTVERGSVLDREFLSTLGTFDIVYSWGVLHHTGAMWEAMGNVAGLVAPRGTLFVALYNDQGRRQPLLAPAQTALCAGTGVLANRPGRSDVHGVLDPRITIDGLRGAPLRSWRAYGATRGMSAWHDVVDWAGGYPFEVATAGQVHESYHQRGFRLERLVSRSSGCNEFVFVRLGNEPDGHG